MLTTSDQLDLLAAALAKAQAEMQPAVKDKRANLGGKYQYAYADLAAVIETASQTLSAHGLSISTPFEIGEHGEPIAVMVLLHTSGQQIVSRFPIRPAADTMQATGSAVSYARRYMLMSLINLPTADDDGQAAMPRNDDQHGQGRRPQHQQSREQLPESWGGPRKPAARAPARRGRPPAQEPVATSELYQKVMETIRLAGTHEELSVASELSMDLTDADERTSARAAGKARREAITGAASRSDAARDSIKAGLTLPKPA